DRLVVPRSVRQPHPADPGARARRGLGLGQTFLAELCEGLLGLRELREAHPAQDLGRLRELDVAVVNDLDEVAPRVEEVEAAPRLDLDAGLLERAAGRLLVVDDEAEMPMSVGRLRPAFGERDELVADVDEGHASAASSELEVEDPSVELERLVDAADLER